MEWMGLGEKERISIPIIDQLKNWTKPLGMGYKNKRKEGETETNSTQIGQICQNS